MLTLARRIGEKIRIGDDITLVVIDVDRRHGKVRIGIDAPREQPVWRQELLPLTQEEPDGQAGNAGD